MYNWSRKYVSSTFPSLLTMGTQGSDLGIGHGIHGEREHYEICLSRWNLQHNLKSLQEPNISSRNKKTNVFSYQGFVVSERPMALVYNSQSIPFHFLLALLVHDTMKQFWLYIKKNIYLQVIKFNIKMQNVPVPF